MPRKYKSIQDLVLDLPLGRARLELDLQKPLLQESDRVNIDKSTIRAFHLKKFNPDAKIGPLRLYANIVKEILDREFGRFSEIDSLADYNEFLIEQATRVSDGMNKYAGSTDFVGFGRASKIFNLTCKALLRESKITKVQREKLIRFAHVPFDSYTLQGICLLETPVKIPLGASMGWNSLNDTKVYLQLQQWLRDVCSEFGFVPLHYEAAVFGASAG